MMAAFVKHLFYIYCKTLKADQFVCLKKKANCLGKLVMGGSCGQQPGFELYFAQLHLMHSAQSTQFGNVTSTSNSQHL